MASISTKLGDTGETSLLYGGRVSKSDYRIEACGVGDETVAAFGMARSLCNDEWVSAQLLEIQRLLFIFNAELATEPMEKPKLVEHFKTISGKHVRGLDTLLVQLENAVELPPAFIIPGASAASAALDVARVAVRRLERAVVRLREANELKNDDLIKWLNRLSDCVFMMARYLDRDLPVEAVTGTRV